MPGRTGRPKKSGEPRTFESPGQFAQRGIVGLKSDNTVAQIPALVDEAVDRFGNPRTLITTARQLPPGTDSFAEHP